jgi:hypothetical protein
LDTRMPSLSSSPRMRSAPQRGLRPAISRMSAARVVGRKPRLRNRVTREATLFPFLRWLLLPAGAFEARIRSGFNLDQERVLARPLQPRDVDLGQGGGTGTADERFDETRAHRAVE